MKVIRRIHNIGQARIIVGYLQANGIDARLLDAETSSLIPVIGGVRIAVDDEQEPKALSLLAEVENS
jgi:hypothetical protein